MHTKFIVILIFVVACEAAITGCDRIGIQKKYTAICFIRVTPKGTNLISTKENAAEKEDFDSFKEKQRVLLTSSPVLLAALRKPEAAELAKVQAETKRGDPDRWLSGILKVDFPLNAEVMKVSCTTDDPREAALLTNAVVDAYMNEVEKEKRGLPRISVLERAIVP
jgi:capsular polysaccharide biosynthesis protein